MPHFVSRTIRISSIMLFAGLLILVAFGCAGSKRAARPPDTPVTQSPAKEASSVKLSGAGHRFVYRVEGDRAWTLEVASWRGESDSPRVEMTGLECRLTTGEQETLRVTAESGHAVQEGDALQLVLSGKVAATEARRGLRLTADRFVWNSTDDAITAANVHWQGLGFDHRAKKGTFATDLSRATFTGRVRTTYSTP